MAVLVVGATGATGKLLVEQLLNREEEVKVIVRSITKLPEHIRNNENVKIFSTNILDLSVNDLSGIIEDCSSIACCLGHNLTFKGMYGQPRLLVTDAVKLISKAIIYNRNDNIVKFILMNTAGNSNRDLEEQISFAEKFAVGALRNLLPPHKDNEMAADFLRTSVGQNDNYIEWSVIRPDSLVDEEKVTKYDIYKSPMRSAIFDPGKTSRINVAQFMADLITNPELWETWKGQMPVIYNKE